MSPIRFFIPLSMIAGLLYACSSGSSGGISLDPRGPGAADAAVAADAPPPLTDGGRKPSDAAPPDYRDPRSPDGACSLPNMLCGGDAGFGGCVAITVDHDNCGMCGRACIGVDSRCLAGSCDCAAPGFDYCATGCLDITSDINNCGRCGNVCDPNLFNACENGQCVMN